MKKYSIIIALIAATSSIFAQNPSDQFWHLAPNSSKINSGVGLEEAKAMMKDKKPTTIVVAVADAGVDVYHPDLQNRLWTNKGEIAGNGIDDDGNGYKDDVYGWNFIGGTIEDNLEVTREYRRLKPIYEGNTDAQERNPMEYAKYLTVKKDFLDNSVNATLYFEAYEGLKLGMDFLAESYGEDMTIAELEAHQSKSKFEESAKQVLLSNSKKRPLNFTAMREGLNGGYEHFKQQAKYNYNVDFDPRPENVGDDYADVTNRFYGNDSVYYGEHSSHGTHVAGIIAADASNDFGAQGICQSCEIMSIRNVPDGDERDKDVANGIRYAVDNGAKIVNMSFGKGYAYNVDVVKEAIKYAESKGVLLVHAAGNSNQDNDITDNFPKNFDASNNWIEVGALSWMKKPNKIAEFSNYGQKEVDLFAPGVAIYSTTPENNYEAFDGTSMASPVVAGVAGFVWSYYPNLTAAELREILLQSAIPIKGRQRIPGQKKKVNVRTLSKTGAEINLPAALKLAETRSK
jgi:cell wall-associated protease